MADVDPRKVAIDVGVNRVLVEGESKGSVARSLGIPRTTLHVAVEKARLDPDAVKELSSLTMGVHAAIAHRAAGRLYERVEELPDDLLIRAYGVASDKLAAHLGVGREAQGSGSPEAMGKALAMLADALQGREVTLSVRDLSPDAPEPIQAVNANEGDE